MKGYYLYRKHPIAIRLEKRISRIIKSLASSNYDTSSLYRAQEKLLSELLKIEDGIRLAREEFAETRRRADLFAQSFSIRGDEIPEKQKKKINLLHQNAKFMGISIELLRYGRWLVRYVADGIAWRAYRYDRMVIWALGRNRPVPFLSGKLGFSKELEIFRGVKKKGKEWLPILNDLTNCLRTFDVSVFFRGILVSLEEIKTTPFTLEDGVSLKGRLARQNDRMERFYKFQETKNLSDLDSAMAGQYIRSKVREEYHFDAISEAICEAREHGYGFQMPEKGLLFLTWQYSKPLEDVAMLNARDRYPFMFQTLVTFRSISPRFEEYHDSLPITAMDIPADDIIDLLFGEIALLVIINFEVFTEQCNSYGLPLQHPIITEDSITWKVSAPYEGLIQNRLFNRVMLEGLSIKSFCDLIKIGCEETIKIANA